MQTFLRYDRHSEKRFVADSRAILKQGWYIFLWNMRFEYLIIKQSPLEKYCTYRKELQRYEIGRCFHCKNLDKEIVNFKSHRKVHVPFHISMKVIYRIVFLVWIKFNRREYILITNTRASTKYSFYDISSSSSPYKRGLLSPLYFRVYFVFQYFMLFYVNYNCA